MTADRDRAASRRGPFVRMWRVLVLLRARPHTLDELADAFRVTKRTIRRDLRALQQIPLPVESRFPTGVEATRHGVRAIDRNVWFVRELAAWPDGARVPVADVGVEARP